MPRDVAVFVGSLRKQSFNRKIAHALIDRAPDALKLEIAEIAQVSAFNQDLEKTPPPDWVRLRERIRRADAVLFVTPEYNRSVPGVLKNAIDVASRPYGENAWNGKPAGVVSVSIGAIGGFGANHHLRQMATFLNMPMMQQPEAYVGNAASLFDEAGKLTKEETGKFLKTFIDAYAAWIETVLKK